MLLLTYSSICGILYIVYKVSVFYVKENNYMKTKLLGCLLAVLFVLVSCSGQAPELMEFLSTETSGDYDFEGYKYYFYHENIYILCSLYIYCIHIGCFEPFLQEY